MSEPNGPETRAPQIQAIIVNLGGVPAQLLFYAEPKEFPLGIEVLCMKQGSLAPVAVFQVPPAALLLGIPPEVAPKLVEWAGKQIAEALKQPTDPGKVKTPGLKLV